MDASKTFDLFQDERRQKYNDPEAQKHTFAATNFLNTNTHRCLSIVPLVFTGQSDVTGAYEACFNSSINNSVAILSGKLHKKSMTLSAHSVSGHNSLSESVHLEQILANMLPVAYVKNCVQRGFDSGLGCDSHDIIDTLRYKIDEYYEDNVGVTGSALAAKELELFQSGKCGLCHLVFEKPDDLPKLEECALYTLCSDKKRCFVDHAFKRLDTLPGSNRQIGFCIHKDNCEWKRHGGSPRGELCTMASETVDELNTLLKLQQKLARAVCWLNHLNCEVDTSKTSEADQLFEYVDTCMINILGGSVFVHPKSKIATKQFGVMNPTSIVTGIHTNNSDYNTGAKLTKYKQLYHVFSRSNLCKTLDINNIADRVETIRLSPHFILSCGENMRLNRYGIRAVGCFSMFTSDEMLHVLASPTQFQYGKRLYLDLQPNQQSNGKVPLLVSHENLDQEVINNVLYASTCFTGGLEEILNLSSYSDNNRRCFKANNAIINSSAGVHDKYTVAVADGYAINSQLNTTASIKLFASQQLTLAIRNIDKTNQKVLMTVQPRLSDVSYSQGISDVDSWKVHISGLTCNCRCDLINFIRMFTRVPRVYQSLSSEAREYLDNYMNDVLTSTQDTHNKTTTSCAADFIVDSTQLIHLMLDALQYQLTNKHLTAIVSPGLFGSLGMAMSGICCPKLQYYDICADDKAVITQLANMVSTYQGCNDKHLNQMLHVGSILCNKYANCIETLARAQHRSGMTSMYKQLQPVNLVPVDQYRIKDLTPLFSGSRVQNNSSLRIPISVHVQNKDTNQTDHIITLSSQYLVKYQDPELFAPNACHNQEELLKNSSVRNILATHMQCDPDDLVLGRAHSLYLFNALQNKSPHVILAVDWKKAGLSMPNNTAKLLVSTQNLGHRVVLSTFSSNNEDKQVPTYNSDWKVQVLSVE